MMLYDRDMLRGLLFSILFYSVTAVMAVIGLPLLLLPQRAIFAYRHLWTMIMLFLLKVICGISYRIEGEVPQKPVIYAAKHQSKWEAIVLYLTFDNPATVMKRSLIFIPFFGLYLWRAGAIAINRQRRQGRKSLKQIITSGTAVATKGRSLLIFPEGKRLPPGEKLPYRSGVFAMHQATGLPVVPVALNSGFFWLSNSVRKFRGEITVKILKPLPSGLSRKEFMERLETVVETESKKLSEYALKQLKPAQRKQFNVS